MMFYLCVCTEGFNIEMTVFAKKEKWQKGNKNAAKASIITVDICIA